MTGPDGWARSARTRTPSDTPAGEPVTIRAANTTTTGFAIPPQPPAREQSQGVGLRLDWARIETKVAETAAVAAVLADIFPEDPPAPFPRAAGQAGARVAGLDGAHATLARTLATRGAWSRTDIAALARGLGLLPDGAMERINDAAIARCGAPLCDGEDPLAVNPRVAREFGA
jgi:TerB-like protein